MCKKGVIAGIGVLFFLFLWVALRPENFPFKKVEFVEVSYGDLDHWLSDQHVQALSAFQKSCAIFLSLPATKAIAPERLGGEARDWQTPCKIAQKWDDATEDDARVFFEQQFTVISYAHDVEGLFTGYFAPEYEGSAVATEEYRYPLYGVPDDLKRLDLGKFNVQLQGKMIVGEVKDGDFIPYKDREAIDKGALEGQKLALVWLKDPVDAFFMHIQGSGVIRYENGEKKLFGYAGKNGKPYQAVGKFLIENGAINKADMSMQAIRAWIAENPQAGTALMWKNPAYIFFRPMAGEAPVGSMNVALTAGRSLAVDPAYVPLGMPIWLELKPNAAQADPIQRLVIAQDTGSAIKGRVRADVYWGIGLEAGHIAGHMKDHGRYYFLVPKMLAQRILSQSHFVSIQK